MKRPAEKQLTKDNAGEEDDQDENENDFKLADPAALSERRIRGLPKRVLGAATTTEQPSQSIGGGTSDSSQASPSRFGAFSGFGLNTPSSFTFAPSIPTSRSSTNDGFEKSSFDAMKPSISTATSDRINGDKEEAALKYCLNIRGLNNAFFETIKKAMDADPLLDMSTVFGRYTTFRSDLDNEFKKESLKSKSSQPSSTFGGSTNAFANTSPAPKPDLTAFSPKTTAPPPVSSSSGSPSKNISATQTMFTFGSTSSDSKPSSFFGKSPQIPDATASSSDTSKGFSFSFKPSSSTPLTPGFAAFTSSPSSKTDNDNTSTSSPAPKTLTTGNLGNPVGFGFGSFSGFPSGGVKLPVTETASRTGTLTPSQSDAAEEGSQATDDLGETPTPTATNVNPYDAPGAGEEEETTTFETKAKAYKMAPKDDKFDWMGIGTGQLKLKVHKSGRRRLLMRNSSNGKIIMNFNLYPGFKTSQQSVKSFTFRVPGEGDLAAVFSIRVGTAEDAKNWQKTLQDEVEVIAKGTT